MLKRIFVIAVVVIAALVGVGEETYAGRVRLAVFDFTDEATTAASRTEAERLGLAAVFDEVGTSTGSILVLDGDSKEILTWITGSREFADYEAAIAAALAAAP